ncbi:MAG: winged-helix domain-containing protein [Dehalococcoidia bacterium]|nr:winged-helix domain-containing protein [Dehalococcoidia bacterium]
MPSVLVLDPEAPPALHGRSVRGDRLTVVLTAEPTHALRLAANQAYDLLVLAGMSVDEQQQLALQVQELRRWRLVPILYLLDDAAPGFAIPGTFRPDMDGLARGPLEAAPVQRQIRALARDGTAAAELVVAGACELDPLHGRLRVRGVEILLTAREVEVLATLLAQPGRTVSPAEIIERSWGSPASTQHLQILRRHVSNIRRKLRGTPGAEAVRTVRAGGYRWELRPAV